MAVAFNYQEYLASREWALLKNQVRARSGGTCERCGRAPHQSTHHKTYERIGHERLDDLLGVCNPCHEWLSGKSNYDPAVQPMAPIQPPPILNKHGQPARVYLAGKIGKEDWRHSIFPGLRALVTVADVEIEDISGGHHSYVGHRMDLPVADITADGVLYGGPYFIACDHGGFHGDGLHGQGADQEIDCCATYGIWSNYVFKECVRLIAESDAVFCWLDAPSAYGTIFELGIAFQLGIPVKVAYPPGMTEFCRKGAWLALQSATYSGVNDTHIEAWAEFIKYEIRSFCSR